MTEKEIYRSILSKIGVTFDISTSSSTTTSGELEVGGKVKVPLFAKAEVGGNMSVEHEKACQTDLVFSSSSSNLEFIASAIKKSGRRVVIEDFHYLSLDARNTLAHDLKTFWDYETYFVIIGVWTQTNLLTSMNPDLSGRIEEISVSWSNAELMEVITSGSGVLNISIDETIQEELIADSFGNVGILQTLLLRLVEDQANIEETQLHAITICNPDFYYAAAQAYAKQLDGLYQQFAKNLSAGIRQRKKSTGIYALAMEAIVNAPDIKLMSGYSRADIFFCHKRKRATYKKWKS